MLYGFLVAAALAIVFALVAIVHRSSVINVLSLVMVFFCMAAIYAMLGMDFLAAIQLIVYSGAVLVLFLFVVMLLNIRTGERIGTGRMGQAVLGAVVAFGIGAAVLTAVTQLAPGAGAVLPGAEHGTAYPIGRALMTTHLFAFEFISLILLAALVGALVLTGREAR